jgi:hypothetical protein
LLFCKTIVEDEGPVPCEIASLSLQPAEPATGSFKDATATIIFFGKSQNQNYDITKNVSLLII